MTAIALSEPIDQAVTEDRLDASPPSPRKVTFYLLHWASLETIAETPSSAIGEAMCLAREWELLKDRRGVCVCHEAVQWPANLATPGSSSYRGPSRKWASDLRADLERAAELLPVCWQVAARIAKTMGVEAFGKWQFRYSVAHGIAGDYSRVPTLDDRPTLWDAAHIMAGVLGWRRNE